MREKSVKDRQILLTIIIGWTTFNKEDTSVDGVIKRADFDLYQKQQLTEEQ